MTRVLVFGDCTSIHTARILRGLALDPSFEIFLITCNNSDPNEDITRNTRISELIYVSKRKTSPDGGNFHYLLSLPKIARVMSRLRPDCVLSLYLQSYGLLTSLVCPPSVRLVHYLMGSDVMIAPRRTPLHRLAARFSLRRADFLLSSSMSVTAEATRLGTVPENHFLTVQYGVPKALLVQGSSQKERKYDLIHTRGWSAVYNFGVVLELFEKLQGSASKALIGFDEQVYAETSSRLHGILGLDYLGHDLPRDDLFAAVANSKFYLSIPSSDGASLSVLEAMALGCIPILSDIPANRELVRHGENGFLVPLDSVSDSVQIIQQALAMPETVRQKIQEYNWNHVASHALFEENMTRINRLISKDVQANV